MCPRKTLHKTLTQLDGMMLLLAEMTRLVLLMMLVVIRTTCMIPRKILLVLLADMTRLDRIACGTNITTDSDDCLLA